MEARKINEIKARLAGLNEDDLAILADQLPYELLLASVSRKSLAYKEHLEELIGKIETIRKTDNLI